MEIVKSEFIISAVNNKGINNEGLNEFMFCGRSNVGKSSFINALCNRKNLARTSQNPGKTQTLNIYLINDMFYFVDVPGYGYARVSKSMLDSFGKMIEDYLTKSEFLKCVFLLVDFRHTPSEDDLLMYNFLKYYNKKVVVIATKADKVKNKDRKSNKETIIKKLNLTKEDTLIITSSETKEGLYLVKEELAKYMN